MNTKRIVALIIAIILLLSAIVPLILIRADALSLRKQYFLEMIIDYSRADMYESDILASLTAAQAILESGWGGSALAKNANNLFGIKCSSSWKGKVYDSKSAGGVLYASYDDFMIAVDDFRQASTWRGYDDWSDSIADHSNLFNNSSLYEKLRGEKDYKKACYAVVECGYTSDYGYAEGLISCIETYGLTAAEDVSANEYGVVALVMDRAYAQVRQYDRFTLDYRVILGEDTLMSEDAEAVWESADESVATVDQDGNVVITGNAGDSGLIRVSIGDRSTCCLIDITTGVEYDGYTTSALNMRSLPDTSASRIGIVPSGGGIIIHDSSDGWYYCTARLKSGETATGWVSSDYVKLAEDTDGLQIIGFLKYFYTLPIGGEASIKYAAGPCTASNQTITWESSDTSVVTVDQDGRMTAVGYGTADVTATASSGKLRTCRVDVSDITQEYLGIVTVGLNVRKGPSTSEKSYGTMPKDSVCTVIGEEVDGWYQVTGELGNGNTVTGWSSAVYIIISGIKSELEQEESDIPDESGSESAEFSFSSSNIICDEGILYGISPDTTAAELKALASKGEISVTYDGSSLEDGELIFTGCKVIQCIDGAELYATVMIRGDVYADGRVNALDYYVLKRYLLGTFELSELQTMSADTDLSGDINAIDYMIIARQFFGSYTIPQEPLG